MKYITVFAIVFTGIHYSLGQNITYTFNNVNDSTANYYMSYLPEGEVEGLLLLLPGFGEIPYTAVQETSIPEEAIRNGIITIVATLQHGWQSFYIDNESQASLDKLINDLFLKYSLENKRFFMGGFSLGGSGVVKYAERAYASTNLKRPNAIFAIDPPLDFERFYHSLQHQKRTSKSEIVIHEAQYFIERINKEYGGDPLGNIGVYHSTSPFSYSDTTQKESKKLLRCPILLISEPDIEWQLAERNRDYYGLNAIDCASMINILTILGNENAVFKTTVNKGYRKRTGERNPHSWSIADPGEVISWLLKY